MKVLLKEDVTNLGLAGEVYTVADGFGRNFLIPRQLAVPATTSVLKQAQAWRERAAARREQLNNEHKALSNRISDVTMTFTAKAGEAGKLYGSITMTEVADRLNQVLGIEIDRRKIEGDPLRHLGEHKVTVRLSGDFQPQFTVLVEAEGATE